LDDPRLGRSPPPAAAARGSWTAERSDLPKGRSPCSSAVGRFRQPGAVAGVTVLSWRIASARDATESRLYETLAAARLSPTRSCRAVSRRWVPAGVEVDDVPVNWQ